MLQKEKPPTGEQVASSIRLSAERYEYIKSKAAEIGISQNAFMMVLIDLGIKLYESNAAFNLPKE